MRIVAALGGNALLRRGQAATAENQRRNVALAAAALAPLADGNDLVVTHGNGPQVGLLALQAAAAGGSAFPLDVLDAETEGMIGYLVAQELMARLGSRPCACLLTQVEVAPDDPAFGSPTKPVGPVYARADAARIAADTGWAMAPDGDGFRRVVPSPRPRRIVELGVIDLLVSHGVVAICAGGGGIPVVRDPSGRLGGVEAVIDKDRTSALLAHELGADVLLLLTDVDAVVEGWGGARPRRIRAAAPDALAALDFEAGSMAPKVAAAAGFASAAGRRAVIGALSDAPAMLSGAAGTTVERSASTGAEARTGGLVYWD